MNQRETQQILALTRAAYPTFRVPDNDQELGLVIRSWHLTLGDLPYEVVERALIDYQRSDAAFAPNAGQLRHLAIERAAVVPSKEQAWQLVLDYIRRHSYLDPTPLAAPQPVLDAVSTLGGIGALRRSESPELDRAHFFRVYDAYRERALRDLSGDTIALGQDGMVALHE